MTTDSMQEIERQRFEEFCVSRWRGDRGGDNFARYTDGQYAGEYVKGNVEFAWCAWQAAIRAAVKQKNDEWFSLVWRIGQELNCVASSFPDGNEHILRKLRELKKAEAQPSTQGEPDCGGEACDCCSYCKMQSEQPSEEATRSQKAREAGFTRRDERFACDECGERFTALMLPIHNCQTPQGKQLLAESDIVGKLRNAGIDATEYGSGDLYKLAAGEIERLRASQGEQPAAGSRCAAGAVDVQLPQPPD